MSKLSLETGTKINRWTVLHWEKSTKRYICQCDCGVIKKVTSSSVKSGASKSCGCYNIEQVVKRSSKPLFTAMFYQVYMNYQKQALLRNYIFDINLDEFKELVVQNCHYCNAIPANTFRGHKRKFKDTSEFLYNGIDRKENNIGYVLNNCVPCCQKCNFAKKNYSYDEWVLWIKQVYENLFIKGSTTIPKGSTLQANGSGKGSLPNKEEDIVSS